MKKSERIHLYGKRMPALPFEKRHAEFRRAHLAERLRRAPHARILEIGCGIAPLAEVFNDFRQMTIVEPCAPFAAKARRLARKNSGITVLPGFLEEHAETLQNRRFDFVVVCGVLHEVDNPKAFLRAVAAVAGGAVVHVAAPNAGSFHRLLALEAGLIDNIYEISAAQKRLRQPWTFDMKTLRRLAKGAGFKILAEGFYAFKPFTHAQMEKLAAQKFFNKKLLGALYRMCKYAPELGSEMFVELRLAKQHQRTAAKKSL